VTEPPAISPETPRPTFTRRALILSVLLVAATYVAVSLVAGLARQQGVIARSTLPGVLLTYALNLAIFGGLTYLLAIRPGRLTWAELGIAPPRWQWWWLLVAAALVIVLLPIRIVVGAIVQLLFGGLGELQARSELLAGELSWGRFFITLIGAGLLVPISEELFFRGLLYTGLRQHTGIWLAVALSSVIFAAGHFDAAGVVATSLIMGIVLALVYEYTHSLWASIAVHALNNSAATVLAFGLMWLLNYLQHP
jgi:hypothetical protein